MTYWAQLLHFYQPPTQTHDVLRRVADESYRPLIQVLREHPPARIAVNMNAVLTQMLAEHGLDDVVEGLRELGERGQVEFVGSGRFHPILPLISAEERRQSIEENATVNRSLFGGSYAPTGFFPPEMCYGGEMVPEIASTGHRWLVISGVACSDRWPSDVIRRIEHQGHSLAVLFRDDIRSNKVSFRETSASEFVADLAALRPSAHAYVVTAMDAETYGHHIRGWEREFLAATYERIEAQPTKHAQHAAERVIMVKPSDLLDLFPAGETIAPHPSSWSTRADDLAAGNPYPLWRAPGNHLHSRQWEYVAHCRALLAAAQEHSSSDESRKLAHIACELYQAGLHSCQYWWASRRPMFDANLVHRGFLILNEVALNATRSCLVGSAPDRIKDEARWRMAAANELRLLIERELFLDAS